MIRFSPTAQMHAESRIGELHIRFFAGDSEPIVPPEMHINSIIRLAKKMRANA
jgi:hypothetical protein